MLDLSPLTMLETNCFIALMQFLDQNKMSRLWASQLSEFDAHIPTPLIDAALRNLVNKGFLIRGEDESGEPYWDVHHDKAFDVYEFWLLDDYVIERLRVRSQQVPAADRFVPLNHNSPDYRETQEALEKLEEELTGRNDLFADSDERLAVVSEVQGIRAALAGRSIRASAVAAMTRGSGILSWLTSEAFSGTIRAAAGQVVSFFLKHVWPGMG